MMKYQVGVESRLATDKPLMKRLITDLSETYEEKEDGGFIILFFEEFTDEDIVSYSSAAYDQLSVKLGEGEKDKLILSIINPDNGDKVVARLR